MLGDPKLLEITLNFIKKDYLKFLQKFRATYSIHFVVDFTGVLQCELHFTPRPCVTSLQKIL